MIQISHTEPNLPFSISYLEKVEDNYRFIVNLGEVNSWILQFYKFFTKSFDTSLLLANEDSYFAGEDLITDKTIYHPTSESFPLVNFGEAWNGTFSTTASCSVYLTIPKIPTGLDYHIVGRSSIDDKGQWWYYTKNDFLNQFKIDVSTSDDFETRLQNNLLYTELNNIFRTDGYIGNPYPSRLRSDLSDDDNPGKIYIKLGDITITENLVSVDQFLRSDVVAPVRYFRLGANNLRLMKIIYFYVYTENNQFNYSHGELHDPRLLMKNLEFLRENAKDSCEEYLIRFNTNFNRDLMFNFSTMEPVLLSSIGETEIDKRMWKNISVYQTILLYKKHAGERFVAENIFDEPALFNDLRNEFWEGDLPPEQKLQMSQNEAYRFFDVDPGDNLLELVNFREE